MKVRKTLKKVIAVIMAAALMLGSCMLASAETGNVTGGESATSETADSWCSLEGIEPLKAGETATINVVANKTVYMNAFEIIITLADEKVEFASERASDGNYHFMKSAYWNEPEPYGAICVYLEESKEVKMAGAGLETEGVKAEAGEIIASFEVRAKEDLTEGDVVATLTHILLKDEVQEARVDEEGKLGECVVKKSEPEYDYDATEKPVISKEEIQTILDENKIKDIIIKTINDIIFTFIQGTMEAVEGIENYDFSTVVTADFESAELPPDVKAEEFVQKITYNHSGKLPGEANIKIFVGEKYNGKWLEYSLLKDDNTLSEKQRVKTDAEGFITVKQNHCSSYVIIVSKNQSEEPEVVIGDVNGDSSITAEDALSILKHVVGLEILTGDALTSADVNADNAITAEDALDVLKKVVGLIDRFVAEG